MTSNAEALQHSWREAAVSGLLSLVCLQLVALRPPAEEKKGVNAQI